MRLLIPDVVASCLDCQLHRNHPNAHTFKFVTPQHAFHTVSIDAIGPFPCTRSSAWFILLAVDHFSK